MQVTGADRVHFLPMRESLPFFHGLGLARVTMRAPTVTSAARPLPVRPKEREGEGEIFVEVFELHEDVAAAAVEGGYLRLHPELREPCLRSFEVLREAGEGPGLVAVVS